jgi:hypothetical protein
MPHIIAICGDLHCGSTVGLCPPEGLELDDGGMYEPSDAQKWLWSCWESTWKQTKKIVGKKKFTLVINGDAIDGDHHRTAQIASPLTGLHVHCALESLRVPLALKPREVHVLRGTPSHVGRSGDAEEGIARALKGQLWNVVPDPDTGNLSSYRRIIDTEGVRLDVAHHGRMGQRAHTVRSYSGLYGFDIWAERMLETYRAMRVSEDPLGEFNKRRPPDIAIRSHNHRYNDSGYDHRGVTRVVSLPAWQFATEYVHRIAAEALADIGIVLLICDKGELEVKPILFNAERSSVMTI